MELGQGLQEAEQEKRQWGLLREAGQAMQGCRHCPLLLPQCPGVGLRLSLLDYCLLAYCSPRPA
jgi:hypothetical protein